MTDPNTCAHVWISNSGQGGEPDFRMNNGAERMHVKCEKCNTRTWFTKPQWNAIPEK